MHMFIENQVQRGKSTDTQGPTWFLKLELKPGSELQGRQRKREVLLVSD